MCRCRRACHAFWNQFRTSCIFRGHATLSKSCLCIVMVLEQRLGKSDPRTSMISIKALLTEAAACKCFQLHLFCSQRCVGRNSSEHWVVPHWLSSCVRCNHGLHGWIKCSPQSRQSLQNQPIGGEDNNTSSGMKLAVWHSKTDDNNGDNALVKWFLTFFFLARAVIKCHAKVGCELDGCLLAAQNVSKKHLKLCSTVNLHIVSNSSHQI